MIRLVIVDVRLINNQAANGSWHPITLDKRQKDKTVLASYRPRQKSKGQRGFNNLLSCLQNKRMSCLSEKLLNI